MGFLDSLRRRFRTWSGREEVPPESDEPARATLVRQRQRRAAERIIENSSLRDGLDDQQANRLLDWGLRQIEEAAGSTADLPDEAAESIMQTQTEAVSHVMRQVNRVVQELASGSEEELRQRLQLLLVELDGFASETAGSTISTRVEQALPSLKSLEPDQVFDELMDHLASDRDQNEGRPHQA